ncbi:MAG: hypothetical protein P1R58_13685, partial [bacterium]|nr:hypothetical protein [bacterium]
MTDTEAAQTDVEISFASEVIRKATHMGSLIIPGSYYWFNLTRWEMLSFVIPAALFFLIVDTARLRRWPIWTVSAQKLFAPIIRKHELDGGFTGASYILSTFCLCVAF